MSALLRLNWNSLFSKNILIGVIMNMAPININSGQVLFFTTISIQTWNWSTKQLEQPLIVLTGVIFGCEY